MKFPAKRFYLVRHGESVANKKNYPAGQMDSGLTRLGIRQAHSIKTHMAALDPAPTIMIASPLSRARETARIINDATSLPFRLDRYLKEQHYGDFTGKNKDGIKAVLGPNWYDNPPGGEPFEVFQKRVTGRLAHWLTRLHDEIPVFVCHGGVFDAAGQVLAGEKLWKAKNCAIAYFEPPGARQKQKWKVFIK